MKIIVKSLLMLVALLVASCSYADAICYVNHDAFTIWTPKGWQADSVAANRYNACVFYEKMGSDIKSSPAVLYVTNDYFPHADLDAFIDADIAKFKSTHTKIVKSQYTNRYGRKFEIREINNGKSPNSYELVAYHLSPNGSLLIVALSAYEEKTLQQEKAIFHDTLSHILRLEVSSPKREA